MQNIPMTPPVQPLAEPAEKPFEWQEYFHAVIDRLWIIAICVVLGGVAAFFNLKDKHTTYRARAVLFIEQSEARVLQNVETVKEERIASVDMVNTVVENIRGYPFALRVAERSKLGSNPDFLAAIGSEEKELRKEEAAAALLGMVNPQFREETRLIDIFVTSKDPAIATTVANLYAEEYLRRIIDQRTDATRSASQFLVDEAERLGQKMRLSEEALQSFREREKAASLETMLAEVQTNVNELSARGLVVQKQIDQVDIDLVASKEIAGDLAKVLKLPSIANDPRVAAATSRLDAAQQQYELVAQRYLPSHPEYSVAKRRVQIAQQEQADVTKLVLDQLGSLRSRLIAEQEEVAKAKLVAEERLLSVTAKSVEYNSLTRNLEADRTLYNSVIGRLKEVDLTKGLTDMPVSIQEMSMGAAPVPVPYARTIIMFLGLGIVAGVSICLLLNKLDPSVQTVEQTERWTGHDVVAIVPKVKTVADSRAGLVVVENRNGAVAEAFRTVRTAVALLSGKNQRQVFLFTSALPSEGKTFSSSNFAATLAQQGFKTLLIDLDLRKPSVSSVFYNENRSPGATELLLGMVPLDEAVNSTNLENLSILTAGGRSENPAELLATKTLETIFKEARGKYDRVVVDSAPVLAVSDTLLLAGLVDVTCLVVRAHSTPKKSLVHAIRLLHSVGQPPAGIILNQMKGKPGYYTYSGRYYTAYGSKGVYGQTT